MSNPKTVRGYVDLNEYFGEGFCEKSTALGIAVICNILFAVGLDCWQLYFFHDAEADAWRSCCTSKEGPFDLVPLPEDVTMDALGEHLNSWSVALAHRDVQAHLERMMVVRFEDELVHVALYSEPEQSMKVLNLMYSPDAVEKVRSFYESTVEPWGEEASQGSARNWLPRRFRLMLRRLVARGRRASPS